jgi:hypothetical protein
MSVEAISTLSVHMPGTSDYREATAVHNLRAGATPRSGIARLRPELNEFITGLGRSLRPVSPGTVSPRQAEGGGRAAASPGRLTGRQPHRRGATRVLSARRARTLVRSSGTPSSRWAPGGPGGTGHRG